MKEYIEPPCFKGCKFYNCYDDGDGRWDMWCSENPKVFLEEKYPEECEFFKPEEDEDKCHT
ncbi:hypothetical protein LCGC14_2539770 [marine sediment metagenome]|uniref:Uncharacterized protein n=1 Tax=marine sediment metagenome TaxID=412755 RepID=A0A0F9DJ46_9ZZZZ